MLKELFENPGLYIISGIKGVGKTTLAQSLMDELCEPEKKRIALYFYNVVKANSLPDVSIRAKLIEISELPLQTGHIYLEAQWAKSDYGLSAVIIDDYRYLLRTETFRNADLSKNEKIIYLLTRFKTLAEVYNIPVFLTCGTDDDYIYGRSDKSPQVSDIQDHQYIEAFADRIVLIHRDVMFDSQSDNKGITLLRIVDPYDNSRYDKKLAYIPEHGRFYEI